MISIIVAMDLNGVIGVRGGAMPWGRGLKDDLAHFKKLTEGEMVIMGRKTFTDDIKRPLPNRVNIIVTRDATFNHQATGGAIIVVNSFDAAMVFAEETPYRHSFVIGGAEIYAQAIPRVDSMFITRVDGQFAGDVLFPHFDRQEWELFGQVVYHKDDRNTYGFTIEHWKRRAA